MIGRQPIVGFNHEVVKGLTKQQLIDQNSHLDAKWVGDKYDEIVPKVEKVKVAGEVAEKPKK